MKRLFLLVTVVILILCVSSTTEAQAESDLNLTVEEAKELVQAWLDDNPLPSDVYVNFEWFTPETAKIDGKDYYMCTMYSDGDWFNNIFINKDTGEMIASESYDDNTMLVVPQPLDEWYENLMAAIREYEDSHGSLNEPSFRRSDYFTGINRMDLLRYPDRYSMSSVYFDRYKVTQVYEPKLYLARKSNSEFLVIDDRSNNGANAVEGDIVSVYGVFYGNETINWTDGRKEQIPLISANLLVINNMSPESEDFAIAFVDTLNAYSRSYGNENEYLYDNCVRLICLVDEQNKVRDVIWPCDFKGGSPFSSEADLNVDGYPVFSMNTTYDGKTIGGNLGGMERLPMKVSQGNLYWMTGYVSYQVLKNPFSSLGIVNFDIVKVEPYNQ